MNASQPPAHASRIHKGLLRTAQQWGGLALIVGSLLFVLNKLDEMSRMLLARPMPDLISGQNPGLIFVGQVALVMGYVSLYRCYAPRVGRSGKLALGLVCGGGILLALGHVVFMSALADDVPPAVLPYAENLFFLVVIGLLLMLLGLIWFGVLTLRRPVMRQWSWLPLATGLLGFGFIVFSGEEITATFLAIRTLFACGLIGLGLTLWMEQPGQANPGVSESGM